MTNTAAGATPGTGANPDHAYPFGTGWAAYRLPIPGVNGIVTPHQVGIGLEGEPTGDGASPPAAGTDPPKPPATPPTTPPATGEPPAPDADGMTTDAGRRALQREREARAEAEKALAELKAAGATDDEKRDAALKAAAAKERDEYWSTRIRQTEVRSALRAAGLTNDKALALAVNAPEFAELKVAEDGAVADLDKTVETFKKDYGTMFETPKAAPGGQPTRGPQNGAADKPKNLQDAVAAHYAAGASSTG